MDETKSSFCGPGDSYTPLIANEVGDSVAQSHSERAHSTDEEWIDATGSQGDEDEVVGNGAEGETAAQESEHEDECIGIPDADERDDLTWGGIEVEEHRQDNEGNQEEGSRQVSDECLLGHNGVGD